MSTRDTSALKRTMPEDNTSANSKKARTSSKCPNCARTVSKTVSSIQCTGCSLWVHLAKCTNFTYLEAKKDEIMKNFKCHNCEPPPLSDCDDEEMPTNETDLVTIVKSLVGQVQRLNWTVRTLVSRNDTLLERNQMLEKKLTKFLSNRDASLNKSIKARGTRFESPPRGRGRMITSVNRSPSRSLSRSQSRGRQQSIHQQASNQARKTAAGGKENRNPRRVLVVQNCKEQRPHALPSASVRLHTERIFVSGQEPGLNATVLHDHLMKSGVYPIVIKKLKTRFAHYSSFYVEIPDTDVDKMFNEDIWNEGAIVKIFNGRLREADVIERHPSQ